MKTYRKMAVLLAVTAVIISVSRSISAHHSMAGYDDKKVVTLTGVVSEYRWRNPHVWVVWDVKDESGKTVSWSGELPAINTDTALGMTKNSLKVGDEIAVTLNPSKLGTTDGRVLKIIKDGAVVVDISLMRAQ